MTWKRVNETREGNTKIICDKMEVEGGFLYRNTSITTSVGCWSESQTSSTETTFVPTLNKNGGIV